MNKEAEIRTIEEHRTLLINMVNEKMDALVQAVENGETDGASTKEYEYPLSSDPKYFKGTKPTALIINGERIAVKTWRKVYTEVLTHANANPQVHEKLMQLRNKIAGRKRTMLSDKPDGMNVPIMLSEGLYAEAYFDTEWLLRALFEQILKYTPYDYTGLSVFVIPNKRYSK